MFAAAFVTLIGMGLLALKAFDAMDEEDRSAQYQREQEALQKRRDLERQVQDMRDEVRRQRPYDHREDPTFLEQYARTNASTLLKRRAEIEKDAEAFHAVDTGRLARNLKKYVPDIYKRRMWELNALAIAERVMVEPPNAPPPRRKPTVEEVRAGKARRETVRGDDATATTLARLAVEKRATARIACEFPELDEDERRQKVREILETFDETTDGTKI